ncbi:CDP-alcohol phosphatidyltransferase family protein [Naumannella sp. ID2617S]|nr:CDP-alcohol phosphatidyltransferase family protein [Naumannella sp. ID2617S]
MALGGAALGGAAQLALLQGIWAPGPGALVAGVVHLTVLLSLLGRHAPPVLGPADAVTLVRAVLAGAVLALVIGHGPVWAIAIWAGVALLLDLVDGLTARRTRTVSEFGARFDLECDAFLVAVLSVAAATAVGPWVLACGALRYLWWLASLRYAWLRAPLPESRARKLVAAGQGVGLLAVATLPLPTPAAIAVAATALGLLCWSFGRDLGWQLRRSRA